MNLREPDEDITDYTRNSAPAVVTLDGPVPHPSLPRAAAQDSALSAARAKVVIPGSDKSEAYWKAAGVQELLTRHCVECNAKIESLEKKMALLAETLRDIRQHPLTMKDKS